MFGILNIYKPAGMTSHDVVGVLRKILKIKQIGHTGTLDPFAEGVLPVCIGKAARLIEYFDDDKEYLAAVQFGTATDTYDLEGKITQTSHKKIFKKDVEKALKFFEGEIYQLPPVYSAIKVNGKKLYEYARSNEKVKIEPRKVNIFKIELKNFNEEKQIAEILISCSKGTYIRSIANDLGNNLGCFAHLIRLIRTKSGRFSLSSAIELPITLVNPPNLKSSKKYTINEGAEEFLKKSIVSPLPSIPLKQVEVTGSEHEKILHGIPIKNFSGGVKCGDFVILVYNNCVDAVGCFDGENIKIKKVLI